MGSLFGDLDFRVRRTADKYGPKRLIVLDLGAASTKAVVVTRLQSVVRWETAALLPPVAEDMTFGGMELAAQLRAAQISGEYISMVVSGRNSTVRLLNFPGTPSAPADLQKQVLQALGLNEAHAVVHEVAFQLGTQDKPEYGVLTASIPAAEVTKLRDAATAANLKPVSLMLSGVVAVNMVQSRPSLLPEDGAVGFLEIGAANSVLLVFAGRDLALARHLRIGLSMMLEALRAATQLDMETAIKLFHSGSFDFSANIAATVKPWLHQIGISLDFFERRYGRSVGVLNLFGGGARSQVIEGMIAERTRCPVNRWSALEGLEGLTPPASAGDDAAPFALAAAEALRTMRIGDSHAV